MIAKIPIVTTPVTYREMLYALTRIHDKSITDDFKHSLSETMESKYIYLTNCGLSSFYIILEALKKISGKKEVVLPAYTAGSLVVAVRKAGLKAVLVDVSLDDFNMDTELLLRAISKDTLAVVCVHMFGICIKDMEKLKSRMPQGVFLIEDCAQAMGSKINGKEVGAFGDAGLLSFNRGKNLPIYGGGCLMTNNEELNYVIKKSMATAGEKNFISKFSGFFQLLAYISALNPYVYGLAYGIIAKFKQNKPSKDFKIEKMDDFHIVLGSLMLKKRNDLFSKRHDNGIILIELLNGAEGIIVPKVASNIWPVFNRLPVVFKDIGARAMAAQRLWANGVETSRMYQRPLHHMFDMGYKVTDFPNAVYLAERLLTLPVHPYVSGDDIKNIADTINEVLR